MPSIKAGNALQELRSWPALKIEVIQGVIRAMTIAEILTFSKKKTGISRPSHSLQKQFNDYGQPLATLMPVLIQAVISATPS